MVSPLIGQHTKVAAGNLSSSQKVTHGSGELIGFFVASSASGTVKLWDEATATGNVILNTTGTLAVGWYPCPAYFDKGLYLTVGGTINVTVVYAR